jgi:hypothetical protein
MVPKHSPVPISRWLSGRALGTRFEVKQPFARALLGWVTPKLFCAQKAKLASRIVSVTGSQTS